MGATKVTPWCPLGVVKALSTRGRLGSCAGALANRDHRDPGEALGGRHSRNRSSALSELHSIRMMLAPGAIACAHSTSRASVSSQAPVGSVGGHGAGVATAADVRAVLVEFDEAGGIRQIELLIELGQVAGAEVGIRAVDKPRIIVGIDDGDGLA